MELTASQPVWMALGHTKFGMCQLPLLSGCILSEVGICKAHHCEGNSYETLWLDWQENYLEFKTIMLWWVNSSWFSFMYILFSGSGFNILISVLMQKSSCMVDIFILSQIFIIKNKMAFIITTIRTTLQKINKIKPDSATNQLVSLSRKETEKT